MYGNFYFPLHPNLQNTLMMLLGVILAFSFLLFITWQLKLIFSSFVQEQPFHELNMQRIRKIGLALIGFSLFKSLVNIGMNRYFITHFKWADGMALTYSLSLQYLFAGGILIILAAIFKLGFSLEEEKKLTI